MAFEPTPAPPASIDTLKAVPGEISLRPVLERMRADFRAWPPSLAQLGVIVTVAAGYFLAGRLGQMFALVGEQVSPVWPPSGIALAALLLFGGRVWPGIWLGAFVANFAGLLHTPGTTHWVASLVSAGGIATGAVVTAWLGRTLVRRLAGRGNPLDSLQGVILLLAVGGTVCCLFSATNGLTWLTLGGFAPMSAFGRIWLTWWLGDVAGIFVFAPLLLAWLGRPVFLPRIRWMEAGICFGLLFLVAHLIFNVYAKPFAFVVIPFLVWPALRFGQRGVTLAALLVSGVSVWGTVHGAGPFSLASLNQSLLVLETFLSVLTLTGLCGAAVMTQRYRADAAHQSTLENLESRVRERTHELSVANQTLQNEAAMRTSAEAQLRLMMDGLGDQMFVGMTDVNGVLLNANRPALAVARLKTEDVFGRPLDETYWLGYSEAVRARTRAAIRSAAQGSPVRYDEQIQVADGQFIWIDFSLQPLRDGSGKIIFLVPSGVNITERKQAEAALRDATNETARNLALLETSLDTLSEGVVISDMAGNVFSWNRIALAMHGYASMDECRRKLPEFQDTFEILAPDGTVVPFEQWPLMRILRGETLHQLEHRVRRKDQPWERWVAYSGNIAKDTAGQPLLAVLSIADITKRKQLEEQLRQSQKMEAIGQLAGGVAHDFNNILAAILGNANLLAEEKNLSAEAGECTREISSAAERAAALTNQLLLFSRRQVMQPRQLNLNEVVTNLSKMLQRLIGEDVHQSLILHTRPLTVHADAGMLDQVLMNLVVNARDAMPKGGRLVIETAEKEITAADADLIPDLPPGRYASLRVTDDGNGIAPEILPHIFEPFFTTKEIGKGTGLGLATVFGIIKQHGGALQVASTVGIGTTFHVFLPVGLSALAGLEAASNKPYLGGSETILLVEDEASVRDMTRRLLQRHGYQVLEARHGVDALAIWEQHRDKIQLLFTDMVMPQGMNGSELAARLRERTPRLRVIFTSGYNADIAGRELKLERGQCFLQKPTPISELLETVRRCLDA